MKKFVSVLSYFSCLWRPRYVRLLMKRFMGIGNQIKNIHSILYNLVPINIVMGNTLAQQHILQKTEVFLFNFQNILLWKYLRKMMTI